MNTVFRILWFEDEKSWYDMEKLRVEGILKKHYLQSSILRKDGDDFDVNSVTGNKYDLILMDFQLADGVFGDKIVAALRENSVLTDILFYSSQEDSMLKAIREKMPPIDGVYLAKRDYTIFTEKVERLIDKIVKRSEDIINLRGFVLDNTSDFESRIKKILDICWQKLNDSQKLEMEKNLSNLLNRKKDRLLDQISKAMSASVDFEKTNNENYLLSISDRLEIFQKIFPSLSLSLSIEMGFREYYMVQIGEYRNKLGHIGFDGKSICIRGENKEVDQEMHRLLRKNIAEVDSVIGRIEKYLEQM